ncbi:MAG: nuclear transport factor 2 family protein [Actinomycetota bacterium]
MDNVQMVKDLYDALGRGDVGSFLGSFDPNIEWSVAEGSPYQPDGKPWYGPDEVLQNLIMKLPSDWDGFTATPKEFHDAGDTVVVECRYTGVNKSTGRSLDAQACHIWKVRDGKVTSWRHYVDTGQLQDVMGAR